LLSKIDATRRDLEAKIAAMDKKLDWAIGIMITMQGLTLAAIRWL